MAILSLHDIDAAVTRAIEAARPVKPEYILSPDADVMVEVFALMWFYKRTEIDPSTMTEKQRAAFGRWGLAV